MIAGATLLDTGPLVALLNRREKRHAWTKARLGEIDAPLLTCEAVWAEAAYLLRDMDPGAKALMALLNRNVVRLAFRLHDHQETVAGLMARYANVPMSLADACLVRMAELHEKSTVMTFDGDFGIYRKHGRQAIATLTPP